MGRLTLCAVVLMCFMMTGSPVFSVEKHGETGNGQPAEQPVTGTVLKHSKEILTIKDSSGKEIHLHLGEDTKIPGLPGATFKPGDAIEATVTPDGHATSVRPRQ